MVLVQTPLPKLFTVNNKYKSVPKMFSAERRQTHQSHLRRVGGGGGKSQRGFLEAAGQLLPRTCTLAASPVLCQWWRLAGSCRTPQTIPGCWSCTWGLGPAELSAGSLEERTIQQWDRDIPPGRRSHWQRMKWKVQRAYWIILAITK